MRKKKIPIAIIGKNFGYKVLAKAIRKSNRFELKAISFKSNNFKKNVVKNLPIMSNWMDLIKNKDIEAIVIATPPTTHEKIINFAIKHHKHIFCEKPCSISSKKVNKFLKKIKQENKFISHMVNYELEEINAFRYFKSYIKKNKLKIKSISIIWNILNRTKTNNWKNYHSKGGGLIFNYFCHSIYYIEKIFGKIKRIKNLSNFNSNKKNDFLDIIFNLNNDISCYLKITSTKSLKNKELFHKLLINTNKGNYVIRSKTIDICDQFSIEKYVLNKGKIKKKSIFKEKKIYQDFRIAPSCYNFKKFADSIEKKKIIAPNFLDAKNIHLMLNKII